MSEQKYTYRDVDPWADVGKTVEFSDNEDFSGSILCELTAVHNPPIQYYPYRSSNDTGWMHARVRIPVVDLATDPAPPTTDVTTDVIAQVATDANPWITPTGPEHFGDKWEAQVRDFHECEWSETPATLVAILPDRYKRFVFVADEFDYVGMARYCRVRRRITS
jgi:hypothetical protein